MRTRLTTWILLLLCAVQLRAQQNATTTGFWANTNNSWALATNIWQTNGDGSTLHYAFTGLPTNVIPTNTIDSSTPITNLFLNGQKRISFYMQLQVLQNKATSIGSVSNLNIQFQTSPDWFFWNRLGMASNALWISDPNYILSFPLSSNVASSTTIWTNSGWTNFDVTSVQAIRVGTIQDTHTNLIATNLFLEYFFK